MAAAAMVIAGAGECGTRAAFTLREEGWDGRIVLVGAEPSPPYERPPLSKTGEFRPLCDDRTLREVGITLISGTEATGLDTAAHALELADGRRADQRGRPRGRPLASRQHRDLVRPGADGRLVAAAAVGQGNAVAKDIKLAEMLIARRAAPRRAVPDPGLLADPAIALKSMLRTGETSARSG